MGQVWHRTGVDRGGASKIFQADPAKMLRKTGLENKGIDDGQSQVDLNHLVDIYTQLSMVVLFIHQGQDHQPAMRAGRSLPDSYSAGQWSWNLARWRRRCDRSLALGVPLCATDLPQICFSGVATFTTLGLDSLWYPCSSAKKHHSSLDCLRSCTSRSI